MRMSLDFAMLAMLPFVFGVSGCNHAPSGLEPGVETGPCLEFQCNEGLVCLSDFCVDPEVGSTSAEEESGGDEGDPPQSSSVSILVVLDNSGSMGEAQFAFARSLAALPDALDAAGLDWRLGVTTTDNDNPWCMTTPEWGRLGLSSCLSRPTDFRFDGVETLDYFYLCDEACPQEWISIDTRPSTIEGAAGSEPRPWIESIEGQSNLPDSLSYSDAINCLVPQGVNGCGFEQPLEAMREAIAGATSPGETNYGFLPDDALLVVVIVSDEVDCSHNEDHESIFLVDGERVFWSEASVLAPTSAVCWNAGVLCTGNECRAADLASDGSPVDALDAEADAVLHPLSRYRSELDALDSALITVIGGVGADGSVVYSEGDDPQFVLEFGIGPGCESQWGTGLPPVRMRELAGSYADEGGQNLFSICEPDQHDAAVDSIVASILRRVR